MAGVHAESVEVASRIAPIVIGQVSVQYVGEFQPFQMVTTIPTHGLPVNYPKEVKRFMKAKLCQTCKGDGLCRSCSGTGINWGTRCKVCLGGGTCKNCYGLGEVNG